MYRENTVGGNTDPSLSCANLQVMHALPAIQGASGCFLPGKLAQWVTRGRLRIRIIKHVYDFKILLIQLVSKRNNEGLTTDEQHSISIKIY
jgi:hypothetical protein